MSPVVGRIGLLTLLAAAIAIPLSAWSGWAAEDPPAQTAELDQDFGALLPRVAPLSPAEALKSFSVQPGFHLELVASEPDVNDPVAICFDENGRLFVCEMRDYSEQDQDFLGVIRMLEDTTGDGRYDKSTIYADGLSWPTALFYYDGGLFVGAAPDIYYFKDTNGDGRADEKKTVFTGFGRTNVQGLMNTFQWGLDNRIHAAASSSAGEVRPADNPQAPAVALRGRDFAIEPRSLTLSTTSGGAQHGMSFDDWGRKFVCSNSNHMQQVMYDSRYLERNAFLQAPSPRVDISADGPQAEVYRTSPVEAWREIRTKLRMSGAVRGAVEGGGRAAGYFTGATGVTIYRGDAWPEAWHGTAIVGDVGSNLVHRKRLTPAGVQFVADRVDDQSEFVSSSDIWFRPAQYANGPDGALYICDVYREVIEHPNSIPPMLKQHLDLTSGRDRGRIYRVVADDHRPRPLPKLGHATTAQLVATLGHANAWHRETAARLLYERQEAAAIEPLRALAADCPLPQGRMHALYALQGLGGLTAEVVLARLDDAHPRVREHAIKLSEPLLAESAALRDKLVALTADDDLGVRYQLAFSLGELNDPRRLPALEQIALRDSGDRWVELAVLSSLSQGAGEMLAGLADNTSYRQTSEGRAFIGRLVALVGAKANPAELEMTLAALDKLPESEMALSAAIARGLSPGLSRSKTALAAALAARGGDRLQDVFNRLVASARQTLANPQRSVSQRVEAVRTLGLAPFAEVRDELAPLLDTRQPQELQLAALEVLGQSSDAAVAELILAAWPTLSPRTRNAASEALFSRKEHLAALLDAIEQQRFNPGELDPARLTMLRKHADRTIQNRAAQLLPEAAAGRRDDVVAAYRDVLAMSGDAQRGKEHFKRVCAACHRVENVGFELGPNLATMKTRGAEAILLNVLDPSREVNPQYVNYVLVTDDGRSLTGMITAENANSVTLTRAENANDTVLRVNIDELVSTGLSIMPEGMEKQLDKQALADVLTYLMNLP